MPRGTAPDCHSDLCPKVLASRRLVEWRIALSGIRPTGYPPYGETAGMADYRRWRVPGGTYFFTIKLLERRSDLLARHVGPLGDAVHRT